MHIHTIITDATKTETETDSEYLLMHIYLVQQHKSTTQYVFFRTEKLGMLSIKCNNGFVCKPNIEWTTEVTRNISRGVRMDVAQRSAEVKPLVRE